MRGMECNWLAAMHAETCKARHVCTCRVLHSLYEGTLGEYWDDRRRLVESHYQGRSQVCSTATGLSRPLHLKTHLGFIDGRPCGKCIAERAQHLCPCSIKCAVNCRHGAERAAVCGCAALGDGRALAHDGRQSAGATGCGDNMIVQDSGQAWALELGAS